MPERLSRDQVRRVYADACCLVWAGEAMQRLWGMEWAVRPVDNPGANSAMPLRVRSGESWLRAIHRARLPEDDRRATEMARAAISSGNRWYSHGFRNYSAPCAAGMNGFARKAS